MAYKDYIPKNDVELALWGQAVVAYVATKFTDWGVINISDEAKLRLDDFSSKVEKCKSPTRSPLDIQAKNMVKKAVEKDFRTYIQGFIAKNPLVTDEDRKMMKITIYDTIPTPVGNPVGLVTATIKYVNEGALELNIKHVEGSPTDKRANYGVKIRYAVAPIDAPPLTEPAQMTDSRFTRRKKELFTYEKKDAKKMAYFCLRYENSKGKPGQWGPVISAVIP